METLRENRSLVLFEGIVFLILGVLAIALPVAFTFGIEQFLGWLFLIGGIVQAWRTFKTRDSSGVWASILAALLLIAVGIVLLAKPLAGVVTLTALLAIFFTIEGIFKIFMAASLRQYSNWGWLLFSGIIALILGGIIWSGFPGTALWVPGLLVGIDMLFFGYSLIILYAELKRA